jgi:hypothetical protein
MKQGWRSPHVSPSVRADSEKRVGRVSPIRHGVHDGQGGWWSMVSNMTSSPELSTSISQTVPSGELAKSVHVFVLGTVDYTWPCESLCPLDL